MNQNKYRHVIFSLAASGLLLAGMFLLLKGMPQAVHAAPNNLFVSPTGSGDCSQSAPCNLPTALSTATDGNTIYLAGGTYTGSGGAVVTVTKSITLYGGWDGATTTPPVRDPDAYPTTLDGEKQRRGIYIDANISPMLDGLRVTNGNATGRGGPWAWDAGGGIYIAIATTTINNCQVYNNTADSGGGVFLYNSPSTLHSNAVMSNTADSGGGLSLYDSAATLSDNIISGNVTNVGGGLFLSQSPATLHGNTIFKNTANTDSGGGLYLHKSDAILEGNVISENTAHQGGGLSLNYSAPTLNGNTFTNNAADTGGGLSVNYSAATLSDNTISNNTAHDNDGGLILFHSNATLNNNTISGNTSNVSGGGISIYFSDATLSNNIISGNTANIRGGGVFLYTSDATLNGNIILDNTADGASWGGGGLFLEYSAPTLTNNIIINNQISGKGAGIYIHGSSPRLRHNTLAHNTGGDGSGVYVTDYSGTYSTVVLTDTILVSHTVGIMVTARNTATLNTTLWYANGTNYGGNVNHTNGHSGNPAFNTDGYHLTSGSAAIDQGVDAGVSTDIDGDARPQGSGYDIGADEFTLRYIYLPLIMNNYP